MMIKMIEAAFKRVTTEHLFSLEVLNSLQNLYAMYFKNECSFKMVNEEYEGIGSTT